MTINAEKLPWWKRTTVYQIYPRSYKDTTGNGVGDIKGIISKLDHIKDLGVETIWFSPFYPSPTDKSYKFHDVGYDISNYRDVNSEYGNMKDFDNLLKGIHDRGMKIVMDMVMNHTSVEHEWFKESRSSLDNPKRDWYIWRDGKGKDGKKPPNNWRSMILGSAWQRDPITNQWYYHEFLNFQPDLNYRNPEVQKEMLDTVRFWLKKGVDGFRLDIINALFEDSEFKNEPFTPKVFTLDGDVLFRKSIHQLNHPDTIEFCKQLRSTIDEFPNKFMVGEVSASYKTLQKYLGEKIDNDSNNNGLNLIFTLDTPITPLKSKSFKNLVNELNKWFPEPFYPTLVFGNHDQLRRMTRLGNNIEKMKLNAAFQLTSRGIPFIYYGEEIGMISPQIKRKNSKDAVSYHFNWIRQPIRKILYLFGQTLNRDDCRTPMQWDSSENAGFCSENSIPWLPVNKEKFYHNVESQEKDSKSLLHVYKRFLKIRSEYSALQCGSLRVLEFSNLPKSVLAYEREVEVKNKVQTLAVFLNFSKKTILFPNPLKDSEIIVSTYEDSYPFSHDKLKLSPWEGLVLKIKQN